MHSETKPRGRLARRAFRTRLDAMRDKGVVEERTLRGYVCDECDVEDPVGYRVIDDFKDEVETGPITTIVLGSSLILLGGILGLIFLFIFALIGILILLAGLGFGVWFLIDGLRALAQGRTVKTEGNIVVREDELFCAICYGSPVSVDTTRGQALLRRVRSNSTHSSREKNTPHD